MKPQIQNKQKSQHWVPRSYLRHFATLESKETHKPLVWIFSKDTGDPTLTSTRQVAAENYLYSPKGKGGTRLWDTEDKLAGLEGVMADIWPLLLDGFADFYGDEAIRKALALFISTLHLRHPRRLSEAARIHANIVKAFEELPTDEHGNPAVDAVESRGVVLPFDCSRWAEYKVAGTEEKRQMFVDSLNQNAIHFAEILMNKRWSVGFSEAPDFITTDTPVAVSNNIRAVFGLNTPGTLVSFPLSPTRVLLIDDRHDQPQGRFYPVKPSGVARANFIAWNYCERFMISPRPTDAVCAEILAWTDSISSTY